MAHFGVALTQVPDLLLLRFHTSQFLNGLTVELLALKTTKTIPFSPKRLTDSLSDYLNGRGTTSWNVIEYDDIYEKGGWIFGINVYDYLIDIIENAKFEKVHIQDVHLITMFHEMRKTEELFLKNWLNNFKKSKLIYRFL